MVYSLSRCCRRVKDLFALLDDPLSPLALVSVSEQFDLSTTMGRAFAGMISVLAQMESELAGERTRAAARARAKRSGSLVTQDVVDRVVEWRRHGWTHRRILAELRQAVPGRKWHLIQVQTILKDAMPPPARAAVLEAFKELGSVEAVAAKYGVSGGTVNRWLSMNPGLRREMLGAR